MSNLPAHLRRLSDIVDEYDAKVAAIPATVEDFKRSVAAAEMAACIGGQYVGSIFYRSSPSLQEHALASNLLESAWKHVYHGLNLDKIAPASDRSRFETAFKSPAPFTLDNIRATFGKYISDPRGHILRGLAEAFGELDQSFKSHDRMKIGVKGLPKRVILSSVTDSWGGGYGTARLRDMLNALCVYNGLPHLTHGQFSDMLSGGRVRAVVEPDTTEGRAPRNEVLGDTVEGALGDVWLKRFANGNGHLFFGPVMLKSVNEALAEYYGEVLPDCPEARPERAASTAVARDLQFYRTPAQAADLLVDRAEPRTGMRILEPSCGDGAIMDAVKRFAQRRNIDSLRIVGVEVSAGRALAAKAKGYAVQVANFLQVTPTADFDMVLMNPPFYGKHYQKHVEHARKFLKPDGVLYAILPITALTDHDYIEPGRGWDKWKDLPAGSFSESGTNINTGIARFFA
jgi:predicted RNA methylase